MTPKKFTMSDIADLQTKAVRGIISESDRNYLCDEINSGAWDKFIAGVMGYKVLLVHRRMFDHQMKNKWTLTIAPRGIGKSTINNTCYHIHKINRDRDLTCLVISKVRKKAQDLIRLTRDHYESNSLLASMGGHKGFDSSDVWSASELTVAGRTRIASEATVTAMAIGGSIVGKHFDLIIPDDLVDDKNCEGLAASDLISYFNKELLPMLNPYDAEFNRGDEMHVIGTRYSDTDLYQFLIESGQFEVLVIPVYYNKRTMQNIANLDELKDALAEGDLESIWPERFTVEALEKRRVLMQDGDFFSQYMGNVNYYTKKVEERFLMDNIKEYSSIPDQYANFPIIGAADLSTGKESGDPCVIGCGTCLDEGPMWLREVQTGRLSREDQVQLICDMDSAYNVSTWGVEANGFQYAVVEDLQKRGVQVEPIYTSRSKKDRFRKLRGILDYRGMRFRKNMRNHINQIAQYPDVDHDDFIDFVDLLNTHSSYNPEATCEIDTIFMR